MYSKSPFESFIQLHPLNNNFSFVEYLCNESGNNEQNVFIGPSNHQWYANVQEKVKRGI